MRVQPGKHAIDDPLSAFLKECVLSILISDIDVHLIRQILSSVLCSKRHFSRTQRDRPGHTEQRL